MLTKGMILSDERATAMARVLLLAVIVSMLVSTSVAIAFEFTAYATFLLQPALRSRVVALRRNPVAIGLSVFVAAIVLGALHGPAAGVESASALFAWRRVLILPLALAVFDDTGSKLLAAKVTLLAGLFGASASFLTQGLDLQVTAKIGHGIIFQNYATQGMFLSVGAAVAMSALLRNNTVKDDRLLGNRLAMGIALLVLVVDIIYVLPGRSGYVTVVVFLVSVVVLLIPGSWRLKVGAGAVLVVVLTTLLASSAVTRSRVSQALAEIADVDRAAEPSSLGQRVVFVRNTMRMIADHPVFGVGTGGFLEGYRPYAQSKSGWQRQDTGDPHNQFLKILAEQGVIGLVAMLFFLYQAFACPAPAPYRQLAIAVLLGWCSTSLASSHFSTFAESRMIFFWLGAMLSGLPAPVSSKDTAG
jgi:O-antigen ligase